MTKIADVIVPEVFNPYVSQRTTEIARFLMGGIISTNPELDVLAANGGKLINMPFWEDLTGESEILSDSNPLTPDKITASQDVAALHMRGKSWTANDLAKALSGDDPMGDIAGKVATFWARDRQRILVASLDGVIADNEANDGGDMVAGDGSAPFDADLFVDGQATFGDVIGGVQGVAFHPTVYHGLKKRDGTAFEKESEGDLEIETYRGLRVIVDRKMPEAGGVHTTYLFGNGAFGMGTGAAPVPSETDRDALAGDDFLISRDHFVMHPRGIKFTNASVAAEAPSSAELANAANWDRVYEREAVRVAAIKSNG